MERQIADHSKPPGQVQGSARPLRSSAAQFKLRLPDELRDRIQAEAARNGRSMNTEIVARLAASLEAGQGAGTDATIDAVRKALGPHLDRILALLEKK